LFGKFLALLQFPKFILLQEKAFALQRLLKVLCTSSNGLISSFQSGFRPGYSTATDIARVSDDIRLNMESNQPTILVLLDFSKAFHSVCHGLFILKLRWRYGFHTTAAALVSSYLLRGLCFSSGPNSGWCSSRISYIATLFFSVY
jgi:hypothetical protein